MPRKTDKIAINDPFFDRRSKLIPCQKEMIKAYYADGDSITSLAKRFNVSKRTIQFILFPERRIKNVQDRKERIGSTAKEYGNKYFAEKMRAHREYKKDLLKANVKV